MTDAFEPHYAPRPSSGRRGKPKAVAEIGRVMRIFAILYDEFRPHNDALPHQDRLAILAVAERIAARTEGP
jgi:hypothetical protein